MADEICAKCGHTFQLGDFPFCPHGRGTVVAKPDDIPGGLVQENGWPTPRTFYSWSERARAMKEAGLQDAERHVGTQGSDKSPHSISWASGPPAGYDPVPSAMGGRPNYRPEALAEVEADRQRLQDAPPVALVEPEGAFAAALREAGYGRP